MLLVQMTCNLKYDIQKVRLLLDENSKKRFPDLCPPHLRLFTALLFAHWTCHQHLWLDCLTRFEMCGHQVCQAVDEGWITVGRGAASYPLRPHLLAHILGILNVQLVKGLDVVIDEGDGDEHQVLLSPLDHH